jgi:hypothetical protein
MFASMRKRMFTPVGVISIIALVFAMAGAAWAAGGLTKSQKKQVTKIAKKYAGKNGTNGTNGTNGAAGEKGPKGDPGAPGAPGASVTSTGSSSSFGTGHCDGTTNGVGGSKFEVGASTTYACNGKNGTTGFTETLPEGKTETGVWGSAITQKKTTYDVSFPIPLASDPNAVVVKPTEMNNGAGALNGCPWEGTGTPTADPGKFCAYLAIEETVANLNLVQVTHPHWEEFLGEYVGEPVGGASAYGAALTAFCVGNAEAVCNAYGAWAVTAP